MPIADSQLCAKTKLDERAYLNYMSGSRVVDVLKTNQYAGKRCFVIGGGESLSSFNFESLTDEITVGINKSFLTVPSTILYLSDYNLYIQIQTNSELLSAWNSFKGIKVLAAPQIESVYVDAYVARRFSGLGLPRSLEEGIECGNNSGFGALVLAHLLGCNPIYLLGFDLQCISRTHWHEGYSGQTIENQSKNMNKFKLPFNAHAKEFQARGVSVINLNPDSALDCFEKLPVSSVI